ncbi:serine hydrolase domain-containing protein [Erythrobacter rubeus]|uniref:Serine hydrolase n=1 Tax=Erythrobacter rubeus TaxID=2760803 RepID=A0ABR8KNC5_9SPHN|nr:serine hydrolase [Erythrobacter rubeus]MBD2842136.1 serine hydrolase [Erythrobacter rubeus]
MKKRIARATLGAALLSVSASGTSQEQSGEAANTAPFGLWVWSAEEPDPSRALTLKMIDGSWLADVDGSIVKARGSKSEILLMLPDGQAFRGQLNADRSEVSGYWFQPPNLLDYQYVATPVVLKSTDRDKWRANIEIQPRPFTVFLDVFKGKDGSTAAVIRNPEGNNTLGASQFRVEAESTGGWSLVSGSGEQEQRHRLFQQEHGGLRLQYDRFNEPIGLIPASHTDRLAYVSRPDNRGTESYSPPPQLNDGWRVGTPEQAGFDREALHKLTDRIAGLDPRTEPHLIHSLLISRRGSLVYEEYFYGHGWEKRHDVRSLGKVFGSVMVGALQQQGHAITAEHRPVAGLLRDAGIPAGDDRKADITLHDLMTFTSGLDCDVNSSESAGNEWNMWEQEKEPDYWLYTAKLAMFHDPGSRYAYCSGSANLVGASLVEFGEAPVHQLFDELIAKPLDFGPYHWALAPNGEGYLGGGAYIRPRDILKIGKMYVSEGRWNGRQIISANWVEESTKPYIEISPETTGMTPEAFQNSYFGGLQAYIWVLNPIVVGDRSYTSYQASGNGGQLLIVVPDLELVVAITGGNYRMGGIWGRWRDQIVGGYIIPALTDLL